MRVRSKVKDFRDRVIGMIAETRKLSALRTRRRSAERRERTPCLANRRGRE